MDWKNTDGNKYIKRNQIDYRKRVPFLNKVLPKDIDSVVEIGSNVGHNMLALKEIGMERGNPLYVRGVEINDKAVAVAKAKGLDVTQMDIVNDSTNRLYIEDVYMTWGVLIHINPIDLDKVFYKMNGLANKYILMIEHKEPCIRTIADRWYKDGGSMWVMDFGKEFIKRYPAWKIKKQGWAAGKKPKKIDYTAPVGESHIHPNDWYYLLEMK